MRLYSGDVSSSYGQHDVLVYVYERKRDTPIADKLVYRLTTFSTKVNRVTTIQLRSYTTRKSIFIQQLHFGFKMVVFYNS